MTGYLRYQLLEMKHEIVTTSILSYFVNSVGSYLVFYSGIL